MSYNNPRASLTSIHTNTQTAKRNHVTTKSDLNFRYTNPLAVLPWQMHLCVSCNNEVWASHMCIALVESLEQLSSIT